MTYFLIGFLVTFLPGLTFFLGHMLAFARTRAIERAARAFLDECVTAGYPPCEEPCGHPWCEKQAALRAALGHFHLPSSPSPASRQ